MEESHTKLWLAQAACPQTQAHDDDSKENPSKPLLNESMQKDETEKDIRMANGIDNMKEKETKGRRQLLKHQRYQKNKKRKAVQELATPGCNKPVLNPAPTTEAKAPPAAAAATRSAPRVIALDLIRQNPQSRPLPTSPTLGQPA
ncbi:uncharacterized protein E0L32_004982 [Thyridium curvatum]|uniref:Uncharacterized protein n=1 Tax=Thyridium curvatum TaxID=1093900 RepID=A0A507B4X7_9PEZI|nr:uncharacterized protein E0L32_004982 [Thyridium curvatum]TPX14873.1 hypothetical protein E0L32_004982 [Thyridium curvatum]